MYGKSSIFKILRKMYGKSSIFKILRKMYGKSSVFKILRKMYSGGHSILYIGLIQLLHQLFHVNKQIS